MATMYFCTETGNPFSANAVTGDDGVARGQAIKATNAPDNALPSTRSVLAP